MKKRFEKKNLRKYKNMMLRETIGSFLAPFIVPLLLMTYDFPTEVNNIFIVVTVIVGPLVGLLFLSAYLKANRKYKESLKQVSSSYPTKSIPSNSIEREKKLKRISSFSDNKEEKLKVTSYICKFCGNQLIKKASFCPFCNKIIDNKS